MDLFKVKFINEAADLINSLEESVLSLENNRGDSALIEQIFRVMHTFKGNSNMFGFDKIGEFTHHLETIYDLVRAKKIVINAEIFNVTLLSVDHIKNLLKDEKLQDANILKTHTRLLDEIVGIIKAYDKNTVRNDSQGSEKVSSDQLKTFHISFIPDTSILLRGNNLLYLIDDLLSLGEGKAFPNIDRVPSLKEMEYTSCYISWDIFLATSEDEAEIKEVFMFVEGECELKVKCIFQNGTSAA